MNEVEWEKKSKELQKKLLKDLNLKDLTELCLLHYEWNLHWEKSSQQALRE